MFIEWSDVGTYHMEHGQENQDAVISQVQDDVFVVALCDGVSSCRYAREGADIACASISDFFLRKGEKLMQYDRKMLHSKTVSHILYDLKKEAEKSGCHVKDFSSTVACVLFDQKQNKLLCLNIGNGLIGGVGKNGFEIIMSPQYDPDGCYVTTTNGVELAMETAMLKADRYSSVFICSDGMWRQLFRKSRLRDDIKPVLGMEEYERLIEMIKNDKSRDDRSMIVMKIDQ